MPASTTPPPVALTIAGSDPSGGAGIQADLKAFAAQGAYGVCALTCTTAQIPGRVSEVAAVAPGHLHEQLRLLFDAFPVAAIKTGMLYSPELIDTVISIIEQFARDIPLVVDPVMVATSGDSLLDPAALEIYRSDLLPRATLFTPNLDEAGVLLDGAEITAADLEASARDLCARYGAPALLKGGHLRGSEAIDVLALPGAKDTHRFAERYIDGVSTHGTGCTYSAAIAARLAQGEALVAAVGGAKAYITSAIVGSHRWPTTHTEALNHFP